MLEEHEVVCLVHRLVNTSLSPSDFNTFIMYTIHTKVHHNTDNVQLLYFETKGKKLNV